MAGPPSPNHSPVFDPAEATSALEDSDSELELSPPRDYFSEGGVVPEQGTVAPTTDREASAVKQEARQQAQENGGSTTPKTTAKMRKARRKALIRKLGLTNASAGGGPTSRESESEAHHHHRTKSVSSLNIQSRPRRDVLSSDEESGYSSA